MNPASDSRQLGDYRLKELLSENPLTRTWLAEQVSISRLVLVDELRDDQTDRKQEFLADVRAKAAVDHPLIGSVFEAAAGPDVCFFAHERLDGVTLAERSPLLPGKLAHLLRRVAEAQLQLEALDHATSPLGLESIHLDEQGVIRLENLAIAGSRAPGQSVRDIVHLGSALVPLLAAGRPGATRLLTLLSWMRGEGLEAPISWAQTRDYCLQIEHQLADPPSLQGPGATRPGHAKKRPVMFLTLATLMMLVVILVLAFQLRPPEPKAPPRASLPGPVTIAPGDHPTPDGAIETLPAFQISAHEVTIGQYAEFLETLAVLAKDNRAATFDAAGQPPEKSTHEPDNWPALLAAAKAGATWLGLPVTLDSPVVGVDWWDAAAYAEWKKARLPTQEEWFAALSSEVKSPAAIVPAAWIPVTTVSTDRTPVGLVGMAGSVCEWTREPAPNPANPLGERLWVIIGGSHLKPGSNALTREWTDDRSLRRPDLGFRIVSDPG